jgi:hypothetical protein
MVCTPGCVTGELLKWKMIVVLPLIKTNELAGRLFTIKSLASTLPGSTTPIMLITKSVGGTKTVLPHNKLVTEQAMGVGVGDDAPDWAQYLPPVFKTVKLKVSPPQTIISLPVQTAV